MRYVAIFVAAVVGGLIGAAGLFFISEHDGGGVSTPAPRAAQGIDHSEDISSLEDANADLRKRIGNLEGELATRPETRPSKASVSTEGKDPEAIDVEALKKELLDAARDEAVRVAKKTSDEINAANALNDEKQRKVFVSALKEQLKSTDANTRREAVRKLRHLRERAVSGEMQTALSDENAGVRREAAEYFEDVWDKAALPKLTDMMMNDENLKVQEHALDALNESGDEDAIRALTDAYLNAKAIETAYEAGKALAENKRTEDLPKGLQRFRDALSHSEPSIREYGVAGLRRWGTSADEPYVRPLLSDENADVQDEARRALRKWGFTIG
ncbi:HEAT repeat domain-containing protein [Planctomycetota bacterium]|nr:HEAT repeat domain-containing protein [Planctomycetota bacterium]